jgi:hypothetical protein
MESFTDGNTSSATSDGESVQEGKSVALVRRMVAIRFNARFMLLLVYKSVVESDDKCFFGCVAHNDCGNNAVPPDRHTTK